MAFTRARTTGLHLTFRFEGNEIAAEVGDTVASALLAAGVNGVRATSKGKKLRLPFCMMGACFDCLVEIDGTANQQACMVDVRQGMNVRRNDFALVKP